MTSLEEDVCVKCGKDNGINSKNCCKYCGYAMCKNVWSTNLNSTMIVTIIRTNEYKDFINFFKGMEDDKFVYEFKCNKVGIDYNNEGVMFYVNDLPKPIVVRFERVHKLFLGTQDIFPNYSWLNIKLVDTDFVKLSNNTYNEEIFNALNKII